jgi:hypothetical protein
MKTTNESNREQACCEVPPAELEGVQGGSASPAPSALVVSSEWEALASWHSGQQLLNHPHPQKSYPGA